MCYKCSSTGAVAKLSTAYLEEAKRNHTTCDAHLVPRAVLGTPSTRCSTSSARRSPTSHEQEPPRHLGLRKLNETAARASRARAHAGGAADRAAQPKLAVWPRRGRWSSSTATRSGGRPIVEKESARGGGHQGQRGGSRRSAGRSSHLVILLTNVYALTALLCTFTTLYFYNFSPTFANGNSTTSSSVRPSFGVEAARAVTWHAPFC